MIENNYKYKCEECGWIGAHTAVLEAANPFEPKFKIFGCPECKSVDQMTLICEAEGCNKPASCGTQTPGHYAHTCDKHIPIIYESANSSGSPP